MGKGASKDVDPQYLVPSGKLYERCEWEPRVLKNMILSKKLSPFFPPLDTKLEGSEECPICMMCYYGGLNRSVCCGQPICSECFCQVRKPKHEYEATCPFCNSKNYNVTYRGPKSMEEKRQEELEEQRVIELQLKMKQQQEDEQRKRNAERSNSPTPNTPPPMADEYRRELEQYEKQEREDRERLERMREERKRAQEERLQRHMEEQDAMKKQYFEELLRQRILRQQEEEELLRQSIERSIAEVRMEQSAISNIHEYVPQEFTSQLTNSNGNQQNEDLDDIMLRQAIQLSIEAEKREQEEILRQLQQQRLADTQIDIPVHNDDVVIEFNVGLDDSFPTNANGSERNSIEDTRQPSSSNFYLLDDDIDISLTGNDQREANDQTTSVLTYSTNLTSTGTGHAPSSSSSLVDSNVNTQDEDEELRLAILLSMAEHNPNSENLYPSP